MRTNIGRYPGVSLADARKQALVLLGSPIEKKKKAPTFADALKNYFEIHGPTLKPRTLKELKRTLKRHFEPVFRYKRLDDIEHGDISDITDELAKKTPSEAWHAFKDARAFFKWCVPRYIKHSPMEGLKSPAKYVARKRVLTDPEIRLVWRGADKTGYPFGTALQFSLLWGTRWTETIGVRWPYINEKERTITLPETKNRAEHHFPYGDMTAALLARIPRLNSTDLLFPGRDGEKPWNGAGKAKWEFGKNALMDPWQIRDLRRTFGTKLAELRVSPHIVERLLNHKLGTLQDEGVVTAVAAVYNRHRYLDEMREAVGTWEVKLTQLVRPH
jgi:integrase